MDFFSTRHLALGVSSAAGERWILECFKRRRTGLGIDRNHTLQQRLEIVDRLG
jgi:hypothetical protein